MAEPAMRNFPVPEYEELPEDLQERIDEEREDAGFVPNVFSALGYDPAQFRAFFAYHDALVEESALERHEIEEIVVTVSGVNDCLYCVVAHGALVRIYARDPQLADQLATNHRAADLPEDERAMLDFVVKLTETPGKVTDADREALAEHYSQREIWEITSVASFYNLSNRLAIVADMRPNEEFYTLGRGE